MSEPLLGHFVAIVGRRNSKTDSEPFGDESHPCDFGPLPCWLVISDFAHSSFAGDRPPVGDATIDLVGDELIATGRLWTETSRGNETAIMLGHLGSRAKFSVSYKVLMRFKKVLTSVRLLEAACVLQPAEESARLVSLKSSAAEVTVAVAELREIAGFKALAAQLRAREEAAEWSQVRVLARRLMDRHARMVA